MVFTGWTVLSFGVAIVVGRALRAIELQLVPIRARDGRTT
jgi:hypothetical protein